MENVVKCVNMKQFQLFDCPFCVLKFDILLRRTWNKEQKNMAAQSAYISHNATQQDFKEETKVEGGLLCRILADSNKLIIKWNLLQYYWIIIINIIFLYNKKLFYIFP